MAYRWPAGTVFKRIDLDVEDRSCPVCALDMHVCDHRYHHLWTLQGPTHVVNRLVRCPDPTCESRGQPFSPEAELSISMPRWCMGWDVLCWLGHRRCARHWSVPQLRAELKDTYTILLSDDAIERYLGRYQTMLAARQQAPERLRVAYRDITSLVLTIDGLQPEKGHETLYVVRELMGKRVWFAAPLLSSATQEVRRLIALARQWAESLDKPVRVWMSDKQDAFVKAIAAEFEGIPHRYCQNHFLRDVAQPVLELDSRAKVKMRSKVRGLRAIERRVLEERRQTAALASCPSHETPADDTPPTTPRSGYARGLCRARLWAGAARPAPWTQRVGRCLAKRASRMRRERSCSVIARRFGAFSTTTRAVHFTHRGYGCARRYRRCASRWIATLRPKKGACRVVVEASGRLH